MSDLGGLDFDEEETLIYLKSNEGLICDFKESYLNNIELVKTILRSDRTAGRTENDAISLSFVDNEVMLILQKYIEHHKEKDYSPEARNYNKSYNNKITRWDRHFLNNLDLGLDSESNEDADEPKPLIERLYYALQYLMYDTFFRKLSCKIGNTRITDEEYRNYFSTIDVKSNSDSDEKENN